jgi:hypothetical protein
VTFPLASLGIAQAPLSNRAMPNYLRRTESVPARRSPIRRAGATSIPGSIVAWLACLLLYVAQSGSGKQSVAVWEAPNGSSDHAKPSFSGVHVASTPHELHQSPHTSCHKQCQNDQKYHRYIYHLSAIFTPDDIDVESSRSLIMEALGKNDKLTTWCGPI